MRCFVGICMLALLAIPNPGHAQTPPSQSAAIPTPDIREPSKAEMQKIDAGWRIVNFHLNSAFPANIVKAIDEMKPLVDQTYGPQHALALRLDTLRGGALVRLSKHAEAEAALAANVAALEQRLGPDKAFAYFARQERAHNLVQMGRIDDAATLFEQNAALTAQAPDIDALGRARLGRDLAYLRRLQGRFAESEPYARAACEAERSAAKPDRVAIGAACASLVRTLTGLGQIEQASMLARSLLEGYDTEDIGKARLLFALAEADAEAGRTVDAQKHYGEAAKLLLATEGFDAPNTLQATARARLALVDMLGRSSFVSSNLVADGLPIATELSDCDKPVAGLSGAEFVLTEAVMDFDGERQRACLARLRDFLNGTLGPNSSLTLEVQERLVTAIDRVGDAEPALDQARTLLAAREQVNGASHPAAARAMLLFAKALAALGRNLEAESLATRAAKVLPSEALAFNASRLDTLGDHKKAELAWREAGTAFEHGPKQSLNLAIGVFAGSIFNKHYRGLCPDESRKELTELVASPNYALIGHFRRSADEAHAIVLACQGKWKEADEIYRRISFESVSDGIAFHDAELARLEARRALTFMKNPDYYETAFFAARDAAFYARERRYTPARDSAGKPLGYRTASASAGADPLAVAFSTLIALEWAYDGKQVRLGSSTTKAIGIDEAFRAAQDFAQSQAAASLLEAAARSAITDPELVALIDQQTQLAERIAAADRAAANGSDGRAAGNATDSGDRKQLAELTERLRERFPAFANTARPFGLSIKQTRERLRPGEAVLMIQPVGDAVYSFAVSADAYAWNKAAIDRSEMDRLVAAVRCRIDPTGCTLSLPGNFLFEGSAAAELHAKLIAPVASGLGQAETLYTVTGGSLGSIPLSILVVGKPPRQDKDEAVQLDELARTRWCGDVYALATLPSVSSLRAYDAATGRTASSPGFAGVGDPVLGPPEEIARGSSKAKTANVRGSNDLAQPAVLRSLSSLPGTRRELIAIARALGSPEDSLLLADAATETRVKTSSDLLSARILAFATHAMLPGQLEGNAEPGLVMTPPDQPSAADDGYLTASEAAALKLRADWVVLSACNTAGPADGGSSESLSGLARAFFFAGARSLLVSHWPVLDSVGAAITSETFRIAAARPELSRAQALRLALRGIRSGSSVLGDPIAGWQASWADPWAWAPFSLIESGG